MKAHAKRIKQKQAETDSMQFDGDGNVSCVFQKMLLFWTVSTMKYIYIHVNLLTYIHCFHGLFFFLLVSKK